MSCNRNSYRFRTENNLPYTNKKTDRWQQPVTCAASRRHYKLMFTLTLSRLLDILHLLHESINYYVLH